MATWKTEQGNKSKIRAESPLLQIFAWWMMPLLIFLCIALCGLLLTCFFLLGVAHAQEHPELIVARREREAFIYARVLIKDGLPGTPERCSCSEYDFTLPIPKTVALTDKEINALYRQTVPTTKIQVAGFFDYRSNTVYYIHGQYDTLAHEYVHYFNWNPKQTDAAHHKQFVEPICMDQVMAHLAGLKFEHDKMRK